MRWPVSPRRYIGALDNDPIYITNLEVGALVPFGPEHVAALYVGPDRLQIPYGKFVIVNKKVLAGEAWPQRLIRFQPADDKLSGWWIWSGKETAAEAGDSANFAPCTIEEIIDKYRVLDSVLDEPIRSKWVWNGEAVEYEKTSNTAGLS